MTDLSPETVGTTPLDDPRADDGLVEAMARAMLDIRIKRTDETWHRYRHSDSWRLFEEDARAALTAARSHGGM